MTVFYNAESNTIFFQKRTDTLICNYFCLRVIFQKCFQRISMKVVCVLVRNQHEVNVSYFSLLCRVHSGVGQNSDSVFFNQ